ncbi:phosphoglycerate mutase [Chitinophaga jiangningensis]|uniref:2,3-bisphosphoglycerate-dependent phosphoglycerate mutase n=1 Tax=Chitinophaga jiangningensis TaxID=1419482 RepID=A0A1M6YVS3_9BACT|nr:2,3-bisphosphoglycerate-dependent phosphoglycerate mutase [Chitinophaga jiangningensis]SHL22348.1 phosphoglycerate mutase [Chitinophaga jiangningensis]
MSVKLFLIRHGQSLWNLENRFTGWKDIDLSEKGVQEATEAGKELRGEQIDIAFTSTLIRAQHTLDLVLQNSGETGIPVVINKALNERSYGDLEGLNKADTAAQYGEAQVHIWRRSFSTRPPGGESLEDTYNRVIPYFMHTILPHMEAAENVLIVAHGNSLRALVMFIDNLTQDEILQREIATGFPLTYIFNRASIDALRARFGSSTLA